MDSIRYKQNDKYALLSIALFIAYYTLKIIDAFYIKGLLAVAILLAVIHIVRNVIKTTKVSLIILFSIAAVILIRLSVSNDVRMIIMCLIIFIGMNIDVDDLITWMFCSKFISFIVAMVLAGYKGNACALHGGSLILLYLCLHRKDMKNRYLIVALCSALLLYLYTDTGALLINIGIAFLLLFYHVIFGKNKFLKSIVIKYIFPAALLVNLFCVLVLANKSLPFVGAYVPTSINSAFCKIVSVIDIATSYRISLAATSWPIFGVSLWGGNVDYSLLNLAPGEYFYLDSGMMWLLQGWGIIATTLFMLLITWLMKYLIERKEYILVVSAVVIALWAINEDLLLSIDTNFLIAFLGNVIKSKRNLMRIEV